MSTADRIKVVDPPRDQTELNAEFVMALERFKAASEASAAAADRLLRLLGERDARADDDADVDTRFARLWPEIRDGALYLKGR